MKKFLIVSATVLALAGCAKEVAQVERTTIDGKEYMTFKVAIDDDVISADTKSTVSRTGVFAWEDGDPVYFVDASNNTAEGVFSESATTITVEAGDWISASTAQFTSKTQLNFNNVKGPVIAAQVSGGELHFHHVGSVINVKIADIPYDCTLVLWPNGDQTWGNGSFSFDGEGKPSLDSGLGNIYITKEVTPADEGKDIAISVPNLNYTSGFSVNLKKGDNIFLQKWTNTARDLSTRPTLLNMAQIEPQTLTIAGSNTDIFGTSWDEKNTDNDMELGEDGIWRKSYPYTPATSLTFKVTLDHSWAASWGEKGSSNDYTASSLTTGRGFTVSFTFPEGSAGQISHEQFDTYTVVGNENLTGLNWADGGWIGTTVNDMEEIASGVYHRKFSSAPASKELVFKVAKDHAWTNSWGYLGSSSNFSFTLDTSEDVDVYFYTNNNFVRVAGISDTFRVAGNSTTVFGTTWSATNDDNLMEIQNDGTYKKVYNITKDEDLEYKITRDGSWWSDDPNRSVSVTKGQVLTIYFNPVNSIITDTVE